MSQESFKNHNVTIKEFDGDHWVILDPILSRSLNHELLAWLEGEVEPILKARV